MSTDPATPAPAEQRSTAVATRDTLPMSEAWKCPKCKRWQSTAWSRCRSEYDTGVPCDGVRPEQRPAETAAREAQRADAGRGEEPAEVLARVDREWPKTTEELDRYLLSRPAAPSADALLAAIAKHHAQKADDRCVLDDDELYAAAGLPPVDRRVGDKAAMLENCRRFVERRCEAGGWPTYRELEGQVTGLRESLEGYLEEHRRIVPGQPQCECCYCIAARAALSAPASRPALSPYLPRAADALADAVLDLTDRHIISTRSRAADALLSYCGIRCDVTGDEINAYRKLRSASTATAAGGGGKDNG